MSKSIKLNRPLYAGKKPIAHYWLWGVFCLNEWDAFYSFPFHFTQNHPAWIPLPVNQEVGPSFDLKNVN